MNRLRQKVKEKFPAGCEELWELIGYNSSYKVTTHLHKDSEKATFHKMDAWEVREWAKILELEPSVLIYGCDCGYSTLSREEMDRLTQHERLKNYYTVHAA